MIKQYEPEQALSTALYALGIFAELRPYMDKDELTRYDQALHELKKLGHGEIKRDATTNLLADRPILTNKSNKEVKCKPSPNSKPKTKSKLPTPTARQLELPFGDASSQKVS